MKAFLSKNLKFLRKEYGLSQVQLAEQLGVKSNTISNYEKGVSNPEYGILIEISRILKVSTDELLKEDLTQKVSPQLSPHSSPHSEKSDKRADLHQVNEESPAPYGPPKVVTVSEDDREENIVLVDQKAAAGYLKGFNDPEYFESLPAFRFPGFYGRTYRAFEVDGDSMMPTLYNADVVIASYVESFQDIREGYIHVVLERKEGLVVKRLINRSAKGFLMLNSDNQNYPPRKLLLEDAYEVWRVHARITHQMPPPNRLEKRVSDLEVEFAELKSHLKGDSK